LWLTVGASVGPCVGGSCQGLPAASCTTDTDCALNKDPMIYLKTAGEHAYWNPADTTNTRLVSPDRVLDFKGSNVFAGFAGGQQCYDLTWGLKRGLAAGGSPPALWAAPAFKGGNRLPTNAYLVRLPLTTLLPDNGNAGRGDIAWSGDRMWLVALRDGVLKYRV